jgi:hypothetical protein
MQGRREGKWKNLGETEGKKVVLTFFPYFGKKKVKSGFLSSPFMSVSPLTLPITFEHILETSSPKERAAERQRQTQPTRNEAARHRYRKKP